LHITVAYKNLETLGRIKIDFFISSQKPPQTTFSRVDRHPCLIEPEHEHGTPMNAL